jgi:hypothetical protein
MSYHNAQSFFVIQSVKHILEFNEARDQSEQNSYERMCNK